MDRLSFRLLEPGGVAACGLVLGVHHKHVCHGGRHDAQLCLQFLFLLLTLCSVDIGADSVGASWPENTHGDSRVPTCAGEPALVIDLLMTTLLPINALRCDVR